MTNEQGRHLPRGTPVRLKRGDSYLNTKTRAAPQSLGTGNVRVLVEGVDGAVPVQKLELIAPMAQDVAGSGTGHAFGHPMMSPYRRPAP